ncbi:MAG: hypothetical protein V7L01_23750 [Nostoc sp.]|uniref:hypothetical protein n=1 Tax=Nostoc sp. TaxID=1180 RepID=UPI002FFC2189
MKSFVSMETLVDWSLGVTSRIHAQICLPIAANGCFSSDRNATIVSLKAFLAKSTVDIRQESHIKNKSYPDITLTSE